MANTFRSFPAVDFSKLDLSKLDLGKLDLGKYLPTGQADDVATKLASIARDAAYVVIGFGVLTVQQAQVRRRELVDSLSERSVVKQLGITREQIEDTVQRVERRLSTLDDRLMSVESRIDAAVESATERLPEQAGHLVGQAHQVAKAARTHVRNLVRTGA
ncbi:MAG: hypothetical protein HZB15_03205 [Actinobacteria bacterium]|nr:hypothetical protein [Actinomycetota bacterium]